METGRMLVFGAFFFLDFHKPSKSNAADVCQIIQLWRMYAKFSVK